MKRCHGTRPSTIYPKNDPRCHAANVLAAPDDLIPHLRQDTREFDEPKAQALFETSAEVLDGLRTAFQHYESGAEAATREPRGHGVVTPSSRGHAMPPTLLSRKRL